MVCPPENGNYAETQSLYLSRPSSHRPDRIFVSVQLSQETLRFLIDGKIDVKNFKSAQPSDALPQPLKPEAAATDGLEIPSADKEVGTQPVSRLPNPNPLALFGLLVSAKSTPPPSDYC